MALLFDAIAAGNVAALRALLADAGPCMSPEARDVHGRTALLWACVQGQSECAEVLLAAGCAPVFGVLPLSMQQAR